MPITEKNFQIIRRCLLESKRYSLNKQQWIEHARGVAEVVYNMCFTAKQVEFVLFEKKFYNLYTQHKQEIDRELQKEYDIWYGIPQEVEQLTFK